MSKLPQKFGLKLRAKKKDNRETESAQRIRTNKKGVHVARRKNAPQITYFAVFFFIATLSSTHTAKKNPKLEDGDGRITQGKELYQGRDGGRAATAVDCGWTLNPKNI